MNRSGLVASVLKSRRKWLIAALMSSMRLFAVLMAPTRRLPIVLRSKARSSRMLMISQKPFATLSANSSLQILMPIEITIPRLGWSMEEATFVNWLKKDGEPVKSGQPLFTLENEKATQDVEASDGGILLIP